MFGKYYTTCTNKERLCFCLSTTGEILDAEEVFLEIPEVGNIKSEILVAAIEDILFRFNISINDFWGQSNNRTSKMFWKKKCVATQIAALQKLLQHIVLDTL